MEYIDFYDWQPPAGSTVGPVPGWVGVVWWVAIMVVISWPRNRGKRG
ncbi:MAG: hypothetical protein ACR2FS_17945 [Phormidesmis sp.]